MSAESSKGSPSLDEDLRPDQRPTVPPPPARPSGVRKRSRRRITLDPLEEALISRPIWDSREPEPAIHEILYRLEMGDDAGAVAAVWVLLDGRRAPALTVSPDVLDELQLDPRAALFLGRVDGATPLSEVVQHCGLCAIDAVRVFCSLVERRIIILRPLR